MFYLIHFDSIEAKWNSKSAFQDFQATPATERTNERFFFSFSASLYIYLSFFFSSFSSFITRLDLFARIRPTHFKLIRFVQSRERRVDIIFTETSLQKDPWLWLLQMDAVTLRNCEATSSI